MSYEKAKQAIEASLADAAGIEYIDLYVWPYSTLAI